MNGTYDPVLVALSFVIAAGASYAALTLAARLEQAHGRERAAWLLGGSLAMGFGIWSMHFIGMLALELPVPTSYDVPLTFLSLVIAVLVSAFALMTSSRNRLTARWLLLVGALMGLGIVAMHYTGMAALQMFPSIRYDFARVCASVAIAMAAATVALWIAFRLRGADVANVGRKRLGSALIMAGAIGGMHYTGMSAAIFAPGAICLSGPRQFDHVWLGSAAACFAAIVITGSVLVRGGVGGARRPSSIRLRIGSAFLVAAVLVAALTVSVLWVLIDTFEQRAVEEQEEAVSDLSLAGSDDAMESPERIVFHTNGAPRLNGREMFVIDPAFRVVAATQRDEIDSIFPADPNGTIAAALAGSRGGAFLEQRGPRAVRLFVTPLYRSRTDPMAPVSGALILDFTEYHDKLMGITRKVAYIVIGLGVVAVLLIAAWGLRVARAVALPIAELERGTLALAAGDYDARVRVRSKDEIGALADTFNRMADDLRASRAELMAHQRELEQRVQERTLKWQQAEQAQRSAAQELRLIAEHLPLALSYVDDSLAFRFHNWRFAQMAGRAGEDIDGQSIAQVLGPDTMALAGPWVERVLAGEQVTFDRVGAADDVQDRDLVTTLIPRKCDDGTVFGFYAMTQDVSELRGAERRLRTSNDELRAANEQLRQAQDQLLQSEKMASIGQLAAGVAHEINNPIGYVNSNLGTLHRYLTDLFRVVESYQAAEVSIADSRARDAVRATCDAVQLDYLSKDVWDLVEESKEGITRVRKIVQDLKNFSRSAGSESMQSADVHAGLDSTLNIVWNELKYKAEVHKKYGELPHIQCRPAQLNQVFLNLFVNAAQAIRQHGTIWIRTGVEDERVFIEVEDTGVGIKPENLKRIFDPFFTTKPVGKGTGLGLSLAYGIVRDHGGHIDVRSVPGEGTVFRVWLPVRLPDAPAQAQPSAATALADWR